MGTSSLATNGFARTYSPGLMQPGPHEIELVCTQLGPEDFRLARSTLSVIAIAR